MTERDADRPAHRPRPMRAGDAGSPRPVTADRVRRQPPRAARPPRTLPWRGSLLLLTLLMIGFAGLLAFQLYQLQIVGHTAYAEQAAAQHYKKVAEIPKRGVIYDRNGIELAGTTYVYRIGVTPKDVRSTTKVISKQAIGNAIAAALGLDPAAVATVLQDEKAVYIQLAKDVSRTEADALRTYLNDNYIGGVAIDAEPRRYYTNGSLASQVLGYTHYSNGNLIGQLGIELEYNTLLTGQPGYTYVETDNYRSKGQLPFSVPTSLRARNGQNLVLNLDINIQKIVQEELQNAIAIYDIKAGGSVIIMDPYTGGILAMASYPYFNSEDPTACPATKSAAAWNGTSESGIQYLSSQVWRNRSISDTYEPGSTFKSLTAAIALEEGLTRETELFNDKPFKLQTWTIHCAHYYGHGTETLLQGFWNSCNPVFAQLALRTGVSRYYNYVRSFGFMDVTGIDLPAEGQGIMHSDPQEIDMATLSYGESSTVTPLQLATAYCTFANGGNLIRPAVVRSTTDETGAIIRDFQPETVRKVISESTSTRVRELMKGVVLYGTGSEAYVEGYAIAGKTSTSTDDNGDHTISFAAVAPAESPEIVTLVVLNKPKDKSMTSKYAAKTCGQIIARTLEYLGTPREYSDQDLSSLQKKITVPDIKGLTVAEARKVLGSAGFRIELGDLAMSEKSTVRYQYPKTGTRLHNKGLVFLYPRKTTDDLVTIPDFSGKTINECQSSAAESGLNIIIDGNCLGVAVSQDPAPTFTPATSSSNGTAANPADDTAGQTDDKKAGAADSDDSAAKVTRLPRGSSVTIQFAPVEETVDEPEGIQ